MGFPQLRLRNNQEHRQVINRLHRPRTSQRHYPQLPGSGEARGPDAAYLRERF